MKKKAEKRDFGQDKGVEEETEWYWKCVARTGRFRFWVKEVGMDELMDSLIRQI